jgi:hypothetical protein
MSLSAWELCNFLTCGRVSKTLCVMLKAIWRAIEIAGLKGGWLPGTFLGFLCHQHMGGPVLSCSCLHSVEVGFGKGTA